MSSKCFLGVGGEERQVVWQKWARSCIRLHSEWVVMEVAAVGFKYWKEGPQLL